MARRRKRRQRGTGQVFEKAPGSWAVRWWENRKCRFKGGFATREEAERVLAKIRGEISLGRAGMPPDMSGVPTLAVLAEPYFEQRKLTKCAGALDASRWANHLKPHFGHLKPHEVDTGRLLDFIEAKRNEGLNPATVRILISILSSLFAYLRHKERALANMPNPCRGLPDDVRALIKPTYDPDTTPFVEKLADVRRIYLDLPEPLNVAYAIGALAGLRTGEVFALRWVHVDLDARRIHVRESVKGPLKDKKSRVVPILDALAPILAAWKLETGGEGRIIPPLRCDGKKVDKHTPGKYLRATLKKLRLQRDGLGWYEATRHTFASQWVMAGNSIEKLSKVLGHYSVVMTERYAHLRPDLFSERDLGTIDIDLRPGGEVVDLAASGGGKTPQNGPNEHPMSTHPNGARARARHHNESAGAAL